MGGGRRRLPRAEGRRRSKPSLRDHVVDCTCVTLGGWGGDGRPRHAAATGLDVRRLRARRLIVARLSRCRKVMYRFSCGCRCGIGSWPERGRGGHRLRSRCRRWRMASSDSCFCLRHLPLGPSLRRLGQERGGSRALRSNVRRLLCNAPLRLVLEDEQQPHAANEVALTQLASDSTALTRRELGRFRRGPARGGHIGEKSAL